MDKTLFLSAIEAADMLRRREVSSRELTGKLLARIDEVNPAINAVVELRWEAALEEAASADHALARGVAGSLHGVPMTGCIPPGAIQLSRTMWRTRMRPWCGG